MVGLTHCQEWGERRRWSLGPDESHIPISPSLPEGRKFSWHGSKPPKQPGPAGTNSRRIFYLIRDRCLRGRLKELEKVPVIGLESGAFLSKLGSLSFYDVLWQATFRNQTTNSTSVLMDGYYGKSDNWHLGMLQRHQLDLHHPLHHSWPFWGVKPQTIYKKKITIVASAYLIQYSSALIWKPLVKHK